MNEIPEDILEPHLSLIDFLKDCNMLIHEGQYTPEEYLQKVGWGHSSIRNVSYLLQQAEVPLWLVTHHDPRHNDQEIDQLAKLAEEILKEEKISCKAEWIPDMYQLDLK